MVDGGSLLKLNSIQTMPGKPHVAKRIDGRAGNGGARPGSGPKPGSANGVTRIARKMADELVERGESPLDFMHENLMFWWKASNTFGEKLAALLISAEEDEDPPSLELRREAVDLLKNFVNARDKAQACAVDAAPYCHPRLQSIAFKPNLTEDVEKVLDGMTISQAAEAYGSTIR